MCVATGTAAPTGRLINRFLLNEIHKTCPINVVLSIENGDKCIHTFFSVSIKGVFFSLLLHFLPVRRNTISKCEEGCENNLRSGQKNYVPQNILKCLQYSFATVAFLSTDFIYILHIFLLCFFILSLCVTFCYFLNNTRKTSKQMGIGIRCC